MREELMRRIFYRTVWFALVVWPYGLPLRGQYTSQEIGGFVHDASGGAVPAARVRVRNIDTSQARTTSVENNGSFVVPNLPIGSYELQVEAPGFRPFVKKGLTLDVGTKLKTDVGLEVGGVSESVTVTAGAEQVEGSTGEIGRLVTGKEAARLQLNGRNFAQLLLLVPGVSGTNPSPFNLLGAYGAMGTAQSINGSRNYQFSWNIDGVDNKDNGGGGNQFVNIDPDALAEFKVMTSNYSAEYGQNAGAVINMALKSGTQTFHGLAYEYLRNNWFDARPFNAPGTAKLRFNNFGWNLGGPVYIPRKFNVDKSKLFFFLGEEFKRVRQGSVNLWNVPTLAQRAGNFSGLPASQWPVDITTRSVFPNGIIPASRFSPNSVRMLDNYPAPNFGGPGGNFRFLTAPPLTTNEYIYKADYYATPRHQFTVHYVRDWYAQPQDVGAALVTYDRDIPGFNSGARWTFVISPTTVNTFQFGYSGNRLEQGDFQPNPVFITDYTRKGEGITFPAVYGMAREIPSFQLAGYTSMPAAARQYQNFERIFQWRDDFSKVAGSHSMKFGALIMRSRKNQDSVPRINGLFAFQTGHSLSSGNAVADALLGNFYQYEEADIGQQGWFRFTQAEFYAQDNWKVSRRLSLDFGFRYEYIQPWYSALQNMVSFAPQYYNPASAVTLVPSTGAIVPGSGNPYNGLVLGGSGFPPAAQARIPNYNDPAIQALFRGLPQEITSTDYATPGPRVGFAFDLTGHENTVLRGGAGMFYERVNGITAIGRIAQPPFVRQVDIYSGNVENPTGGTNIQFASALTSGALDLRAPRVANWSLGIQHKLSQNMLLDAAYVGSSGWSLYRTINLNQLPLGTVQKNPGKNINALRPYLGFGNITQYLTGSNSNYNALQVAWKYQMKGGGLLNLSYTWSRAIDDASQFNALAMNSFDFKLDRGLSDFNRTQIFVLSYVYPLPRLLLNYAPGLFRILPRQVGQIASHQCDLHAPCFQHKAFGVQLIVYAGRGAIAVRSGDRSADRRRYRDLGCAGAQFGAPHAASRQQKASQ